MTQTSPEDRPANRRRSATALVEAAARRGTLLPRWLCLPLLAVLLGGAWAAAYVAGGSSTALPHLFYVPVVLAALPFGSRGSVLTALAATVLAGPLMPLDVAASQMQDVGNWALRGMFFLLVALLTGAALALRERHFQQQVTDQLAAEIDRSLAPMPTPSLGAEQIKDVLTHRRFHPVFQPVYSLRDGRLKAVEALTRFDVEPPLTPDVWFTQAAVHGYGVELELAAIEEALTCSAELPVHVSLSVNASPATLVDPRFLDLVRGQTARILVVEVTEHAAVADYRMLQGVLEELRSHGVRIAVDDAGAGVSGLLHIVQLVPDVIKVDLGLSQGVGSSPVRRALATSLIDFANRTGAELVVEGIELSADLHTWAELGAHAVQGYLVGRPGPLPFPGSSARVPGLRDSIALPQQRSTTT